VEHPARCFYSYFAEGIEIQAQQNVSVRGAIYGITAASIWGGMYVVSDEVLRAIPPFTLLTIRIVIGATILAAILARSGSLRLPVRDALKLFGVGLVGYGISLGAQFVGTDLSNAVNGAVVTSASPAFILLFAWLLLREPLNLTRIGAVVLASIGVLIVVDISKIDLGSETFRGNLILAVAAITWGLYSVLVRRVSASYSTLVISFYALVGGLFISLPAAAVELTTRSIAPLTVELILGILYLGVISTALAMVLWNRAFALVEAGVASLFFFAQPLVGVLLGAIRGQPVTPQLLIGGTLIIGGVLLSMLRTPNAVPAEQANAEPS
jgi:drug/metabolite transporter (DMT)-like permease